MEHKATLIQLSERHSTLTAHPKRPGEFRFEDDQGEAIEPPSPGQAAWMNYACPLKGGGCGRIRVGNGFKPNDVRSTWQWNGSTESPTLSPSINCLSHNPEKPSEKYAGCGWHGYLTDGVFKPA